MNQSIRIFAAILIVLPVGTIAAENVPDSARDILVTFENTGATASGGGFGAPYRNRKRYSIAASARRNASAIEKEYSLVQIDHWPIRSLSVYCFVYRVPDDEDRDHIIARLEADTRVESVQPLQVFETGIDPTVGYNDTYVQLQHGLTMLGASAAHNHSRGVGIRVAIIDSQADVEHEDLRGRVTITANFAGKGRTPDTAHGTAVASIIGASANNEKGIVGIAPEAELELVVACWAEDGADSAVCNSFTLAQALDTLLADPPHILNMSLVGPQDSLLERLIEELVRVGVVVIAASSPGNEITPFPASLDNVIGVRSSDRRFSESPAIRAESHSDLFAPGKQIMVAVPQDRYDFRSGSSLAAAHVSGAVALLLSASPQVNAATVSALLQQSQDLAESGYLSVDACRALHLADSSRNCEPPAAGSTALKLQPGT